MRNAFFILLILLAVGVFYIGISPTYEHVKVLKTQIADYQIALDNSAELRRVRKDLVEKYNSLNKDDIARAQKLLPDGVDNIRLILDINAMAAKYGMSLKSIRLSPIQVPSGVISSATEQGIGSIQLGFSVLTSYQNFLLFLHDLESSLRLVDLASLSFTADDKIANQSTYSINIQTYWLK